MINIDNSEKGFESDIEEYLLSNGGYIKGNSRYYDKKNAIDLSQMMAFIQNTQPDEWKLFSARYGAKAEENLLKRFQAEVSARGLIAVLRDGISDVSLRGKRLRFVYFNPPSALNESLVELYNKNILACTRQLYYSEQNKNSVDMVLFINGIPVVALELKNQQKGQDVRDGIRQWKEDRDPREPLFRFDNRILVYFAVDHYDVYMATALSGENTFFMPFNQGSNGAGNVGGAGNPQSEDNADYVTAYLWKKFLCREGLLALLQKYISRQKEQTPYIDTKTRKLKKKESEKIIFPRYHQYDVVEKCLADVLENGVGKNYLIQHSAGSGKSNSIAWLTYRLSTLFDKDDKPIFNSVIVVTDRRILNAQLQDTIESFAHKDGQIKEIKDDTPSSELAQAIDDGVAIIVCTLFRFSVILKEGKILSQEGKKFAIIIDEAHSSQNGESAQNLKTVLADTTGAREEYGEEDDDGFDSLDEEMLRHGKHNNQCFFAFTATPKPKTLEKFGVKQPDGKFKPFHVYSMKQAIEEGFILDVLKFYTTFENSYEIVNNSGQNPEVLELPTIKALKEFQRSEQSTIDMKTALIVEQFRQVTLSKMKTTDGVSHAKTMVVASSRKNAVQYYFAIRKYIAEKGYTDILPLVAFSGKIELNDTEWTEPKLNALSGSSVSEEQLRYYFASDMFNALIVADKYQTGFDEPQLHTMFVDKKLKGVKAVQTLSRLNRTCAKYGKVDTYILDFVNTKDDIQKAFEPFYTDTELESEIDPNKLYSMRADIEAYKLITADMVEAFATTYDKIMRGGKARGSQGVLTSIIKPAVDGYNALLPENRDAFRKLLKGFARFYAYVTQIIRIFDKDLHKFYICAEWIFRQLPKRKTEKWVIDVSLLNNSLKETFSGAIELSGEDNVFKPTDNKTGTGGKQMELLDVIIERINAAFGENFTDGGRNIVRSMYETMSADKGGKLSKMVKNSDEEMFVKSIFPDYFAQEAGEAYTSQADAFTQLFQDDEFYKVVMEQLARAMYRKFKK